MTQPDQYTQRAHEIIESARNSCVPEQRERLKLDLATALRGAATRLPALTGHQVRILAMQPDEASAYAIAFRQAGRSIPLNDAHELAFVIHWMLGHYIADPINWADNATLDFANVVREAQKKKAQALAHAPAPIGAHA